MINFNTSYTNPLANLKPRVKGVDDINSKTNSANATNSDKTKKADSSIQDDFSWKFGTPWEIMSDEWLQEMSEQTKKSFQKLTSEYERLTKDMPVGENSIYQQLINGTANATLISEINEFKNKNDISQFVGSGVGSLLDKDIETLYRTATNADEFKAGWLELKEKRSQEMLGSVLENGFTNDMILSNDDINALHSALLKQISILSAENSSKNLIKIGGISLLGYAANGETTIMGKFLGYDKTMSETEVMDLQNFLYENALYGLNGGIYLNDETSFLLDSTMSVENFKKMWLEYKTITEQGGIWAQAKSETMINSQEPKEIKKLFQATNKSQIYKNLDIHKTQNLLQDTQKTQMFEILFGTKFNTNLTI